MLTRHDGGRLHMGVLFKEASDLCTDACGTGTVCFRHMTARLQEVADLVRALELQVQAEHNHAVHNKEVADALLKDFEKASNARDAALLQVSEYRAIFGRIVEIIDQEDSEGDALLNVKAALAQKPVGVSPLCEVQVNCHGGRCGKLKPCDDHVEKRICEHKHCQSGKSGCTGGQGSCSCECDECIVIRNIYR
jgi:hypothetical protein